VVGLSVSESIVFYEPWSDSESLETAGTPTIYKELPREPKCNHESRVCSRREAFALMRQYLGFIKSQNPDLFCFSGLATSMEMFDSDAHVASRELRHLH